MKWEEKGELCGIIFGRSVREPVRPPRFIFATHLPLIKRPSITQM